jgi:hypothetical protein
LTQGQGQRAAPTESQRHQICEQLRALISFDFWKAVDRTYGRALEDKVKFRAVWLSLYLK